MRAEYVPTDAQRALVENAAAFGLTQADIAEQLKIGGSMASLCCHDLSISARTGIPGPEQGSAINE
jgi:hypothetical protein